MITLIFGLVFLTRMGSLVEALVNYFGKLLAYRQNTEDFFWHQMPVILFVTQRKKLYLHNLTTHVFDEVGVMGDVDDPALK
jgi:hypothetical protein